MSGRIGLSMSGGTAFGQPSRARWARRRAGAHPCRRIGPHARALAAAIRPLMREPPRKGAAGLASTSTAALHGDRGASGSGSGRRVRGEGAQLGCHLLCADHPPRLRPGTAWLRSVGRDRHLPTRLFARNCGFSVSVALHLPPPRMLTPMPTPTPTRRPLYPRSGRRGLVRDGMLLPRRLRRHRVWWRGRAAAVQSAPPAAGAADGHGRLAWRRAHVRPPPRPCPRPRTRPRPRTASSSRPSHTFSPSRAPNPSPGLCRSISEGSRRAGGSSSATPSST